MANQDTLESPQHDRLVKSLQLALEIEAGLAKDHWSDSECVYSFAMNDYKSTRDILYSIVGSWEKPKGFMSPFWYLNKMLEKSPPCVNWTKFSDFLDKCRYRYEWLSRPDQRAFAKNYPYVKGRIDEAIQAERNAEAATKKESVAERNQRLFEDGVQMLIANPSLKGNEILKALYNQEQGRVSLSSLKKIAPLEKLKKEVNRRKVK